MTPPGKNSNSLKIFALALVVTFFICPFFTSALNNTYQLMAPIGGVESVSIGTSSTLGDYINMMYKLVVGLASVLAVLMIAFGGFQYASSDAIGNKSAGKEKIKSALLGLILIFGSYLLLNSVNEQLVKLNVVSTPLNLEKWGYINGIVDKAKGSYQSFQALQAAAIQSFNDAVQVKTELTQTKTKYDDLVTIQGVFRELAIAPELLETLTPDEINDLVDTINALEPNTLQPGASMEEVAGAVRNLSDSVDNMVQQAGLDTLILENIYEMARNERVYTTRLAELNNPNSPNYKDLTDEDRADFAKSEVSKMVEEFKICQAKLTLPQGISSQIARDNAAAAIEKAKGNVLVVIDSASIVLSTYDRRTCTTTISSTTCVHTKDWWVSNLKTRHGIN